MELDEEQLLLDACCIMTLFGSGEMREILTSLPVQTAVSSYVLEQEALYTYNGPDEAPRESEAPIDLAPLIEDDLIQVVSLCQGKETNRFLQLATTLDDGEARTIAIAVTRDLAVATDDKKAIRLAQETGCQVATTPDLLKHWAVGTDRSKNEIANVLKAVRARAVYAPGKSHPLYSWWHKHL